MTYDEFVGKRITLPDGEEEEPFCPFHTPNHMGYCDRAYSEACRSCEESLGEYVLKNFENGERIYQRIADIFKSGYNIAWYAEKTEEFLKEMGDTAIEGTHKRSEESSALCNS